MEAYVYVYNKKTKKNNAIHTLPKIFVISRPPDRALFFSSLMAAGNRCIVFQSNAEFMSTIGESANIHQRREGHFQ